MQLTMHQSPSAENACIVSYTPKQLPEEWSFAYLGDLPSLAQLSKYQM